MIAFGGFREIKMDINWLMIFITALISLIVGVLVGFLISGMFKKENMEDKEKIIALEEEFASYKTEVGDHFVETAAMVNQLTSSYKNVYDHLEKGAYKLVGEEELHKRLEDVESQPVLLEYIGAKQKAEPEPELFAEDYISEETTEEASAETKEDVKEELS